MFCKNACTTCNLTKADFEEMRCEYGIKWLYFNVISVYCHIPTAILAVPFRIKKEQ